MKKVICNHEGYDGCRHGCAHSIPHRKSKYGTCDTVVKCVNSGYVVCCEEVVPE